MAAQIVADILCRKMGLYTAHKGISSRESFMSSGSVFQIAGLKLRNMCNQEADNIDASLANLSIISDLKFKYF